MRWLFGVVLFLLALGTLRTVGCGGDPCGGCDDGNPCTTEKCVFVVWTTRGPTGWQCDYNLVRDGTPCGSGCGSGNVCVDGVCGEDPCAGVVCDDGNPCTRDYCDYGNGNCRFDDDDLDFEPCPHESGRGICYRGVCEEDLCVDVVCDDNNLCTEDYCVLHIGCVYEPVSCDDDNQCTEDNCNPLNGRCDFTTPVEDGQSCWADFPQWDVGICEAGVCVPPCDPASGIVTPCPHDYYIPTGYCCPGSEFCADWCRPCGDGVAEPGEKCDGVDLAGMTCADFGFTGGTLACLSNCFGFDRSNCAAICGNDVIEPGEQCDGIDLRGLDCTDFQGFTRGTLACLSDCSGFDTSGCIRPVCGDNIKEGSEVCDGTDLGHWTGQTCADFGFRWAVPLACNATCDNLDLTDCFGSDWTCSLHLYDGIFTGCQCGCGVFDPDCSSWSAVSCDTCGDAGSCSPYSLNCPGDIDPNRNWLCQD